MNEQPTQQPIEPQPQYQPQPAPQINQTQPTQPTTTPGKVMGIVGFILAFVGLGLIGLILSIIATMKAKKAGIKNRLAFAGIILNAVSMIVTTIIAILFSLTLVSFNGVTTKANTSLNRSNASTVANAADAYYAENYTYPALGNLDDSFVTIPSNIIVTSAAPSSANPSKITYISEDSGYCIQYWDGTNNSIATASKAGTGESLCY